jgi:hypothetical protein
VSLFCPCSALLTPCLERFGGPAMNFGKGNKNVTPPVSRGPLKRDGRSTIDARDSFSMSHRNTEVWRKTLCSVLLPITCGRPRLRCKNGPGEDQVLRMVEKEPCDFHSKTPGSFSIMGPPSTRIQEQSFSLSMLRRRRHMSESVRSQPPHPLFPFRLSVYHTVGHLWTINTCH